MWFESEILPKLQFFMTSRKLLPGENFHALISINWKLLWKKKGQECVYWQFRWGWLGKNKKVSCETFDHKIFLIYRQVLKQTNESLMKFIFDENFIWWPLVEKIKFFRKVNDEDHKLWFRKGCVGIVWIVFIKTLVIYWILFDFLS